MGVGRLTKKREDLLSRAGRRGNGLSLEKKKTAEQKEGARTHKRETGGACRRIESRVGGLVKRSTWFTAKRELRGVKTSEPLEDDAEDFTSLFIIHLGSASRR